MRHLSWTKKQLNCIMRHRWVSVVSFLILLAFSILIWQHIKLRLELEEMISNQNNRNITLQLSEEQILNLRQLSRMEANPPTIYAVTPTYKRYVQKAELTRISQTLLLVQHVHWIVVEDSVEKTPLVRQLLGDSGLLYTHLTARTPQAQRLKPNEPVWKKHRGLEQRNAALYFIRHTLKLGQSKGVVYFMDDDNTYNVKIFKEMTKIKKVGIWPVGFSGDVLVEQPLLDSTGKVNGYKTGVNPNRTFAIDMSGFAINLDLILTKTDKVFSYSMKHGQLETDFLSYFTTKDELEPLADNCTKVYVWHTKTQKPKIKYNETIDIEV